MAKEKLMTLGDELEEIQTEIIGVKAQLNELQEREDALYGEIMPLMDKKGLEMFRTKSGMTYFIVKGRVSYKVKKGMENEAREWAVKEYPGIITLAAAKLNAVVQPMLNPPAFIERVEGEPHLSVRTTEEAVFKR